MEVEPGISDTFVTTNTIITSPTRYKTIVDKDLSPRAPPRGVGQGAVLTKRRGGSLGADSGMERNCCGLGDR